MAKVNQFDKQNLRAIREAMNTALAKVEKEYGIKIEAGNARFSGNEVTFKVKANTIGTAGTVITKEAQMWDLIRNNHGLGHISVGDTIEIQGKSFTLKGYNSRASKAPVQIEDAKGKGYKCSISMVKTYNL